MTCTSTLMLLFAWLAYSQSLARVKQAQMVYATAN